MYLDLNGQCPLQQVHGQRRLPRFGVQSSQPPQGRHRPQPQPPALRRLLALEDGLERLALHPPRGCLVQLVLLVLLVLLLVLLGPIDAARSGRRQLVVVLLEMGGVG
jgi:hypothetical protein